MEYLTLEYLTNPATILFTVGVMAVAIFGFYLAHTGKG